MIHLGFVFCCVYYYMEHDSPWVLCSVVYITPRNMIHLGLCSAGCITTWNMIRLGFVFCCVHYYVEHDSPWFCILLLVHYYVEHDSPWFCILLCALLRGT